MRGVLLDVNSLAVMRRKRLERLDVEAAVAKSDDGRGRLTTAHLRAFPQTKEDPLRAQGRHQRFQFNRSQARLRTPQWTLAQERGLQWTSRSRQESAVLITKQMTEIVEACSQIHDQLLAKVCTRSCGMQGLWRWQKRTRQQGSSDELVLLV